MSKTYKIIVPEAKQALENMKMEIAKDLGYPASLTKEMYPAIVNGISVREMVRIGEQMLIKKNNLPSDRDIY